MDSVDNPGGNRDIPPFFAVDIVDKSVDTVDESPLWLCIFPIDDHA